MIRFVENIVAFSSYAMFDSFWEPHLKNSISVLILSFLFVGPDPFMRPLLLNSFGLSDAVAVTLGFGAFVEPTISGFVVKSNGFVRASFIFALEFKFVYIFSLRQAIHGLQTKETDDTCNLPITFLSSGPQVAVKVAQERWQAIDNKKL
jgi:hypothetical protein